jgi:hypothetical protein
VVRISYQAPSAQVPFATPFAVTGDGDGDGTSWWQDAQENLTEQINETGESLAEIIRIMQVHCLRANAEILNGLLEVNKSQLARAERRAPAVEKIEVE